MKHNYTLLSKNTFVYLIITFLVFLLTGWSLSLYLDNYINTELEDIYDRSEKKAKFIYEKESGNIEHFRNVTYIKLDTVPKLADYPQYRDTLLLHRDSPEQKLHRIKTVVRKHNDQYYLMDIVIGTSEFLLLREVIFNTLPPAFIILALLVVISNRFLSSYLFRPFNHILNQMKTYSVGKKLSHIKTNTREFNHMQELFEKMIENIEKDYRNLKEYTENMSHEMQTPLSVLRSKVENLMIDENLMQDNSETVKQIYDEINHLSKMGSTLNLITKIENKEFLNNEVIATGPVIENHINKISELVELKSLKIETSLSPGHKFSIDPILLDIMLTNLLRNAIKYSTADSVIEIKSDTKLEISNLGEPLPFSPEKLFERFCSGSHGKHSLGLGLSIVKQICELNEIKIVYEFKDSRHFFTLVQ